MRAILAAAEISHADGIHPGYGFLSENSEFANAVISHGFVFIGPSPEHIRLMGNKIEAKAAMKALGVSTIPGVDAPIFAVEQAKRIASENDRIVVFGSFLTVAGVMALKTTD
jgi:acetyl-CoA carboxylase biotin carboxylase subunit